VFRLGPRLPLPDGSTFIYREDGKTIDAGNLQFVPQIEEQNFIS
jgi:hypothetical protein